MINTKIGNQISQYMKAKEEYRKENFAVSFEILSSLTKMKFPPAFFLISLFYAHGHHVLKDRKVAIHMAEQGAFLGHLGCKGLLYRYSNSSVGFFKFIKYSIGILPLISTYLFMLFFNSKGEKNSYLVVAFDYDVRGNVIARARDDIRPKATA